MSAAASQHRSSSSSSSSELDAESWMRRGGQPTPHSPCDLYTTRVISVRRAYMYMHPPRVLIHSCPAAASVTWDDGRLSLHATLCDAANRETVLLTELQTRLSLRPQLGLSDLQQLIV